MTLDRLVTVSYRNLTGTPLVLSDGINLLYGKNAAGKTNTLECAYLFASGRSFRTRHETELIRRGETDARADIFLTRRGGLKESLSLLLHAEGAGNCTKRMLYQGRELAKASEFLGIFRAVLFTPDHLTLVKGSPEERRRFMDIALTQLAPRYVYCLNTYLSLLEQKNAYLKQVSLSGKADADYLDVLNRSLASAAAAVIRQRSGFSERISAFAKESYAALSSDRETLEIRYISALKEDFTDLSQAEDILYRLYTTDRASELKLGRTLHGPHRDDLLIGLSSEKPTSELWEKAEQSETAVSEFAARTFGSQGQQRSAVLALKLAEGEVCRAFTGEYPVFLLDDLLGELDKDRRQALIKLICDRQVLITCCDRDAFPALENVNAFQVADGAYLPGD